MSERDATSPRRADIALQVRERRASLALKPSTVTYAEAAAPVAGASTALFSLRDKAHVRAGSSGCGPSSHDRASPTVRVGALTQMLESGQLKPVIDRTYPLREASEAVQHVEVGHARGKVVLTA